jgi:hypothetical protein
MQIRLSPTMIGNLSVNRLAILNTSFFYQGSETALYNFNIYLVDENFELVDSSYINTVPQTATISGADYLPAFDNFSYAEPLIIAQSETW